MGMRAVFATIENKNDHEKWMILNHHGSVGVVHPR